MKKIYLFLVSVLPLTALAQPTITQNDLPALNSEIHMAHNSSYSAAVPAGGANQSWDYSSWTYTRVDTTGFISATGTPYAGLFPSSNLASYNPSGSAWEYFISDNTGFYINGDVSSSGIFVFNPGQL